MKRVPRVFISRTTAGLAALAEQVAEVLRKRGIEPIIQTGFYPSTHDIKGMLAEHLQQCDAVICLIGSAYGSGPQDPITKAEQPVHGLKDPRTKDRLFSYTQLELLIARDLGRPIYTFFIEGDALPTPFAPEPPELAQRQQTYITEFAKDGRNTYGTFIHWDQPADPARGLKQAIEAIKFEITVLAGKPTNLPYTSLGTLFKGRDEFLAELRLHLTAEGPVVIKGKRTIHGMGGVGKTRAAIEYAWKHADDYRALLFISANTPEALHRSLATLCDPLVLNLPEQEEKEQALQVEAVLRWLRLNPGWLLIIDNVSTDAAVKETKALLARLTNGHVLITSRISDSIGHVKSLDLNALSEAASIAFLDERTEERRPKREDDREKVSELVKLLDGLALALEQAGAHISTTAISYADYLALWESQRFNAMSWHDEEKMKYPRSLAVSYETSVAQLSDGAKELFRILAWFASAPIPRGLVDARPDILAARRYLAEIERFHLASIMGARRDMFVIHPLLQKITRQQQPEAQPQSLTAALEWLHAAYLGDPEDVRCWPTLLPLTPHAIAAATFGSDLSISEPTASLLNQAGLVLQATNQLAEAEPLMRRALAIDEASYGPEHPKVATSLNNLAGLLQATNRLAEAEPLLRRALAIDEIRLGNDHPNVARDLDNLARLLQVTNRLAEAEPLMRRALAIDEASYGQNHPSVAVRINHLAQLLQTTNRVAEAEPLLLRALAMDEAHFGGDHPQVAIHLNNLALLLQDTNRLAEAEPLMRRALAIDEVSYGPEHPKVATSLNNLAGLLQATNRLAEAEPLLRRALVIDEACYGPGHPDVARDLNNLAQLFQTTNRLAEAELLMRRMLVILEKSLGSNHPQIAASLNNLSSLLQATGRMAEAEPLIRRALEIDEHSQGPQSPKVAIRLNNLATLLQATGRLAEAEPLMRRQLTIFSKFSADAGHAHPHLQSALMNYTGLLIQLGLPEEEAVKQAKLLMPVEGLTWDEYA